MGDTMSVQTPSIKNLQGLASGPGSETGAILTQTLRTAARRIRFVLMLRSASRALCASALICLVGVIATKLKPDWSVSPAAVGAIVGMALLAAIVWTLVRPLSELDVAKLTERRADLKERLSSALEFRNLRENGGEAFYSEQLADADRHAANVNVKSLYPAKLPWELPVGLLLAIGLFLAFYLPTLPRFWSQTRRQEFEEVKAQGINIVKLAQDTQKSADQQKLEETKKAAEEARKLGEAMKKGKMEKKQALVEMQKLTKKMEETQKRMAATLPPKSMQQVGDEMKKKLEEFQKEREEAQKEADKKAKEAKGLKPGEKPNQPNADKPNDPNNPNAPKPDDKLAKKSDAMKKMEEAMKEMAEAMKKEDAQGMKQPMEKMAQQMQSGQMSKQDMQQMQKMLSQMAKAMQNSSMQQQSQQMQQMAQMMQSAMNNMDPKTMQQIAQMMRQMANMSGKPGQGLGKTLMDMKALQQLAMDLKNGRMTMGMGNGMGNRPGGNGFGGKGPGRGYGGQGGPSKPMKDLDKTNPRLVAMGKSEFSKGVGKSGSVAEFNKFLAMSNKATKHLPNGKIAGARSQNGQELSVPFEGDPEGAHSAAPYYSNVYSSSKKQAESTLNKENIPAAYKEQVRKYFDTIRP